MEKFMSFMVVYQQIIDFAEGQFVSMSVAPKTLSDLAHIMNGIKKAGIMPAQKYKQDDKG